MTDKVFIFSHDLLNGYIKEIREANIRYIMGVDTYEENQTSGYCLMRISDNPEKYPPMVILSKQGRSDEEFHRECRNLAKYFNAKIVQYENNKVKYSDIDS